MGHTRSGRKILYLKSERGEKEHFQNQAADVQKALKGTQNRIKNDEVQVDSPG